ncbi:MAG: hypothetical protein HY705_02905 [Gemmatimonadetes bacterium]|nr:hypothetical protein [Gemmatimonadota bacterium]
MGVGTWSDRTPAAVPRSIALPGWIALSWAVGGGVMLGGFVVAVMTLSGRLSGSGLLLTSSALFVVGAVLGLMHGAVLGYLGRPAGMGWGDAVRAVALALVYSVPALAVGWLVAGWIAMTVVALYVERWLALAAVAVAALGGVAMVAGAALAGWKGIRNGYERWPDRRMGTALVAAAFGALLVNFLAHRPMLWGLELRVTETGAFMLAVVATLWIVGPLVTVSLRVLRALPAPRPGLTLTARGRDLAAAAVAVALGIVLGLVALPFHGAPYAAPATLREAGPAGALVLAVSRAIVDEVLLRLFLVTGLVWLLLRWHAVPRPAAALLAVIAAALVQAGLYLPGVLAIGFPTALATTGYLLLAVLVPGLVFGAVYWLRGLGAALVADATAVAALALLAA